MDYTNDRLEFCASIAVLGGTFDPVHYGHLAVADAVSAAYRPSRVLFVPAGVPPHKKISLTPFENRYHMAQLATASHPNFTVSRMEQERVGFSYTIDTIKTLKKICPLCADIFFILGADAAMGILEWKGAEELLTLCRFVVIPRNGVCKTELQAHIKKLQGGYNARFEWLDIAAPPVSGTEIRNRIMRGESVRYLLPPATADYIQRHRLYGYSPPSYEACRQSLSNTLSVYRYTHTLGVVEASERLAAHYGADINKARTAALLHDCAKEYPPDKKRALCTAWDIPLDDILAANIDLTHGLLGAKAAERDYGVYDEEILQAIRYHTAGHAHMNMLDKIILLADFIEPARQDYPGLSDMRALAYTDMDAALLIGLRGVLADNKARGRSIHPWSLDAINLLTKGR
jgi:nicotinate-nucleotide adenylyltransferase